ncbi:hypothetical protein KAR91_80735 [Candidatus Pacearchaeota archaeon]|nr:hypothetical protein [Candidatus Pacearchaeota archaeon]
MQAFWSIRIWDKYIDAYYASTVLPDDSFHWSRIASRRFFSKDGRWRGL